MSNKIHDIKAIISENERIINSLAAAESTLRHAIFLLNPDHSSAESINAPKNRTGTKRPGSTVGNRNIGRAGWFQK